MLYLLDLFDTEEKLAPKDPVFRAQFYKLMFYCRCNKLYNYHKFPTLELPTKFYRFDDA